MKTSRHRAKEPTGGTLDMEGKEGEGGLGGEGAFYETHIVSIRQGRQTVCGDSHFASGERWLGSKENCPNLDSASILS